MCEESSMSEVEDVVVDAVVVVVGVVVVDVVVVVVRRCRDVLELK